MSAVAPARARRAAPSALTDVAEAPVRVRPVRPRRLSTSGLIWMGVLALLLGGLVALNVAALRSTIGVSDVNTRVRHLQQQNRLQLADIANLSTSTRIERMARSYGMHQSSPRANDFLSLGRPAPSVRPAPAGGHPG